MKTQIRTRWSALLLLAMIGAGAAAWGQQGAKTPASSWVTAWSIALQPNPEANAAYENQTIRVRVVPSVSGRKVRVLLSNAFGTAPLLISDAAIVPLDAEGRPRANAFTQLLFGGFPHVRVFAGGEALSDERELALDPSTTYEVRLYVPRKSPASTIHVSTAAASKLASAELSSTGDYADHNDFPNPSSTTVGIVARVDVQPAVETQAIVVLGSTEAARPGGWVGALGSRLRAQKDRAFINLSIENNAFSRSSLADGPGMVSRFSRDVLQVIGTRYLVISIGDVDFGEPGSADVSGKPVDMRLQRPADEYTYALRQLIARARAHGFKVIGTTLVPFAGVGPDGYHDEWKENMRQQLNHWIRTGRAFDAVIDLDKVVVDPKRSDHLDPRFDDGKGRLDAAAATAVADSVPLDIFR